MGSTQDLLHQRRLQRVLDYIDANPEAQLTLAKLSRVAAFSKYHFHRQFSALFGVTVHRYILLTRLKRAVYQLAFRPQSPVTDIALATGFATPESFARAFKQALGQSPTAFRKKPQWPAWQAAYSSITQLRGGQMPKGMQIEQVKIVEVETVNVAVLEHRDDPELLGDSLRQFIAWRKQNQLPPRVSATFNVFYNDPMDAGIDLCAATNALITANEYGVIAKQIPGGRCAVLRHVGSDDSLAASIHFLHRDWLAQSGEVLRDFPLYCQRVVFFPDVAENAAITDLFLPLR